MRTFKNFLRVTVVVLVVLLAGSVFIKDGKFNGDYKTTFFEDIKKAQTALSDVGQNLSAEISRLKGQVIEAARNFEDGKKPAIPLAGKILSSPDSNAAQEAVAAPVASSELKSIWGDTGMSGLTVYEYGKTLLNNSEKSCYCSIAAAVKNLNGSVTLKTTISPKRIKKVYEYYIYDHTEVFYMDGVDLEYTQSGSSYTYKFTFKYKYGKSAIISMRAQLRSSALRILGAANGFSTDLKKEKALHDRLIRLCSYNTKALSNPGGYPASFSAYGAIVNGSAVCQGYAQAMKLLLSSAGIRSLYVAGQANGGGHAWNMVRIGGGWYYLDATFDDPVFVDASGVYTNYNTVSYTYFNYKSAKGHVLGVFNASDPFVSSSENYATMPKVG